MPGSKTSEKPDDGLVSEKESFMTDQKSIDIQMPPRGFVFWPVGSGDSTTIVVDEDTFVQIDLRHLVAADDSDDPRMAVIDHLVQVLPKIDGKPFLSVFILTHPDKDHCQGFSELLKRVVIGEIWHTPRVFREHTQEFCDDAVVFRSEVRRRRDKMIANVGNVSSGNRVRIIGYDDLLKEAEYQGFPKHLITTPGKSITVLNGNECSDKFRAFVHAPFKDDSGGDRNDTSVALQIRLINNGVETKALMFGDLCYPMIKKIFDRSTDEDLQWNIFLAPHHCSKSVMYYAEDGEKEATLKTDILDAIQTKGQSIGYIVASSDAIPKSNEKGDNPPHAIAKARYQEIVPTKFFCSGEHPNQMTPEPVIFIAGDQGIEYQYPIQQSEKPQSSKIQEAVQTARGGNEPPKDRVGFG